MAQTQVILVVQLQEVDQVKDTLVLAAVVLVDKTYQTIQLGAVVPDG